jgi:hypothetical protein
MTSTFVLIRGAVGRVWLCDEAVTRHSDASWEGIHSRRIKHPPTAMPAAISHTNSPVVTIVDATRG